MAEITWTLEAQCWLQDIFEHIAADDPVAAARTVGRIYKRAQLLTRFPELGYRYQASSRPVRILLEDHFRIAYVVGETGVIILGVFHGALEIDRYLL